IRGRATSQITMSGRSDRAFASASAPSLTGTTSYPSSERVRSTTLWTVMLASASSTVFDMCVASRRDGTGRRSAGGDGVLDEPDDVLGRRAGEEHLRHPHLLQIRDVLRGDDAAHEHL